MASAQLSSHPCGLRVDPFKRNGAMVYASKEEAEYTAPFAFSIAVAASWWAVRLGKAVGCLASRLLAAGSIGWS